MAVSKLWVDKYTPRSLDQYIFHSKSQEEKFRQMIAQRDIPHLLLAGPAGTGKTTLSDIVVNELRIDEVDRLYINASKENDADTIREKIEGFASTYAYGDHFKVVQMDEADALSQRAQEILRGTTQDYSDNCRFIFTCNNDNKLIPPLRSRFQQYYFKSPSMEETQVRMAEILIAENVEFTIEDLEKVVLVTYPDIRKSINTLQQLSVNGRLVMATLSSTSETAERVVDLLQKGDFDELRRYVVTSVSKDEFDNLYQIMYRGITSVPKFKKDKNSLEAGIVQLANYLYKHAMVAIPELNFEALCIELGQI